jgi:hypothetical protein
MFLVPLSQPKYNVPGRGVQGTHPGHRSVRIGPVLKQELREFNLA